MAATSRFSAVSRHALLQGVSTAALLGLGGCANDDAGALTPTAGSTTATGVPTAPASSVSAVAGQLALAFSYTSDTGGMVRNP